MKTARTASIYLCASCAALAAAGWARAQEPLPVLSELSPPGGRPGEKTRLSLVGKRLSTARGLLSDHPGIQAAASEKDWEVSVDAGVAPGLYDLRLVNDRGVSAPRAFHVSPLPLLTDRDPSEGKPARVEIGCRVAGQIEAGVVDRFILKPAAGARVVVECFGERIDSRLDATLEVRDSSGRRVAFSADRTSLDPALAFDAREGVEYTIDLWDFTYGGKYPYLLSISAAPRVLFAFPPAAAAEGESEVTFYGWNLPGGKAVERAGGPLDQVPLEQLTLKLPPVSEESSALTGAYRKTAGLLAGAVEARPPGLGVEPVLLARARGAQAIEREPNDSFAQATPLAAPCEASGRFGSPGDRDWYSFAAKKGQALEVEIESARLGAPCDPVLLIARRGEAKDGKETVRDLLFVDERRSGFPREEAISKKFVAAERDPLAAWTAPDDGEYLIQLRNRNGRHGLDAVYRLCLRPPAPDFSLVVIHSENSSGEAATVPRGGSQSCDVLIERRGGFAGAVRVAAEGLPPGLSSPPVYIAPGENYAPLVFTASADAPIWTGSVRVVGVSPPEGAPAADGTRETVRRVASSAVMVYGGSECKHPLEYVHSRLSRSLVLSVREAAPFQVRLEPAERTVAPGTKVSFRAKLERRDGFSEGVQLSYHGLGEKCFAEEDGKRPSKATMSKDKADQEITLTLKSDAPYGEQSFVVFATASIEYLENPQDPKSKKEKRRATFVSNPATVRLVSPISLSVRPPAGTLAAGGELRIPFEVRRLEGVDGEVEVELELPRDAKGLTAAAVKLEKGKSAGEILLRCAAGAAPEKAAGASVRARVQHAGKRFEEKSPLPAALKPSEVFDVVNVEEAKRGALRIELARRRGLEEELKVELSVASPAGVETVAEVVFPKGERTRSVLVDASSILPAGAGPLYPLRIRLSGRGAEGDLFDERLVGSAAPEPKKDKRTRSF